MWYRVFCQSDVEPRPSALIEGLAGVAVESKFKGDDLGWTAVDFNLGVGTPIHVERYLAEADDLRNDLNTWAAYLETLDYSPNNGRLMELVIQSKQLVTIRKPLSVSNEALVDRVCEALCRTIALATDGIYQAEGVGWFAADGSMLIEEY